MRIVLGLVMVGISHGEIIWIRQKKNKRDLFKPLGCKIHFYLDYKLESKFLILVFTCSYLASALFSPGYFQGYFIFSVKETGVKFNINSQIHFSS